MNPKTLPPTAGQKTSESKPGSRLREADEPKLKKPRKLFPVGIWEQIMINPHGLVDKPIKDESGNPLEFKSTTEADKWVKANAKEGDNDKVYLVASLRRWTVKATKQLRISVES